MHTEFKNCSLHTVNDDMIH